MSRGLGMFKGIKMKFHVQFHGIDEFSWVRSKSRLHVKLECRRNPKSVFGFHFANSILRFCFPSRQPFFLSQDPSCPRTPQNKIPPHRIRSTTWLNASLKHHHVTNPNLYYSSPHPLQTHVVSSRPSTPMPPETSRAMWVAKVKSFIFGSLNFAVFLFLDFVDALLCVFYRVLDAFLEGEASPCYCHREGGGNGMGSEEVSESLYGRRNVFREMGLFGFVRKWGAFSGGKDKKCGYEGDTATVSRWSDCGCDSCVSWAWDGEAKRKLLHVVVREPEGATCKPIKTPDNVILVHGFLCSSSLWTEAVFPNLSERGKANYRFFAVDLLGFGKSPKPHDCSYTVRDHLEAIERSVIHPFGLDSFHLVAHSMGCIIALALAAKNSKSVKSITLIAPPYFPSEKDGGSMTALEKLAGKRLWPPLLFGSAVMSWYEHLGRCVCFVICRNHQMWERILKFLTWKRDLHFLVRDLTRHTHHSAWHTMHNVICGGAKLMDDFLEALHSANSTIWVMHGDQDQVVPIQCTENIRTKIPNVEFSIVPHADHLTVILGREKIFTQKLESIWSTIR